LTAKDIVQFNIDRKFKNYGRVALERLELAHAHIKALELVLIKMGINEEKYSNSEFQYGKDRKAVLDAMNEGLRELEKLVEGFDIKLDNK
jgi:hypothetical protein